MKVLESEGHIDAKIIRFMMVGGTWTEAKSPCKENNFVSDKIWMSI
jgi:DTW domain-containing protein YfiP